MKQVSKYKNPLAFRLTLMCLLLGWLIGAAPAQDKTTRGIPMSEPIIGFVTEVAPGHITLKDMKGDLYDVIPATRIQIFGKDGKPATLNDIHVGDGFNAQGVLFGKTIHALQAKITDPDMQRTLFGPRSGATNATIPAHAFVMGVVSAINQSVLTITGRDGSLQSVTVDAATKFYRVGRAPEDRPSPAHPHGVDVSLGDLHTGDSVSATGSMKAEVFVAGTVTIMKM